MKKDKHTTNVSFYLATYEPQESDEIGYKEVLAVFIDEVEAVVNGEKHFSCYARLGQHSTCCESFLAKKCKKISEKEQYQELFNELEQLGYKLNVI